MGKCSLNFQKDLKVEGYCFVKGRRPERRRGDGRR